MIQTLIRRAFISCIFFAAAPFCQAFEAKHNEAIPAHQTLYELETKKNIDQVLFLMQKRLALMHEVARTKWSQNLAIEDLPREQQLIDNLSKQAKAYGLDEAWTRTFFQAQFDAAKMIQKNDFAIWTQQGQSKFDSFLDLKQDIRPYLDQLSKELLEALGKVTPCISNGKLSAFVLAQPIVRRDSDAIDEQVWQTAILPLTISSHGKENG